MTKASTPAAPDYTAAAEATSAGNLANAQATTEANRVDWTTPYGNLNYTKDPNNPNKWSADMTLSPDQQTLLNQQSQTSIGLGNLQNAATNRVGDALNSPYASVYDPTKATNDAQANLMSRLQPQMDQDQSALDSKLANQGITQGSEAWNNSQRQLGNTQNDAKQQAALQAINLGQSEQAQQYQQEMANRNAPLNELSAIRSGSQVTNPTFGTSAQQATTGGTDYLGATNSQYNAALNASNAATGSSNSMLGGLFGLGGGLAKGIGSAGGIGAFFSDVRLKDNIRVIGALPSGLPIYSFNYIWDDVPQVGVMAQDVEKVYPDAVIEHESGYKMVDYGRIQ